MFLAIKLERACRIQMLAEQAGGPKLFVKEEELAAKRGRTNRGNSQGNAFSYLVRRWHLRCNCEVPKEYQATLDNFDRTRIQGWITCRVGKAPRSGACPRVLMQSQKDAWARTLSALRCARRQRALCPPYEARQQIKED